MNISRVPSKPPCQQITKHRGMGSSLSHAGYSGVLKVVAGGRNWRIETWLTVTLDTWQLSLISLHRPEEKLWAGPPGEGGANQRDDRSALSPSRGSARSRGKTFPRFSLRCLHPRSSFLKDEKLILPPSRAENIGILYSARGTHTHTLTLSRSSDSRFLLPSLLFSDLLRDWCSCVR